MLALVLALTSTSQAVADIEFKSSGPVSIFVDGRQAAQSNPLKHRMSGLEAGVHELRVVGMFGKTLYEAEIDLPDNTITYASWERGEIKVVSTDWLPKDDAIVEDEPTDTGVLNEEEQVVVVEPPPEPPAAEPAGVSPAAVPVAAAAGAGVAVAATQEPEPEPEPEPLAAAEPVAPNEDAVAAVDPAPAAAAPAEGVGAAPVVVAAAAVPVAAAATTAAAPAAVPPRPRTLTVQATEGMRIEVVKDGRKVILVYENSTFRIEDENGFSMELGN